MTIDTQSGDLLAMEKQVLLEECALSLRRKLRTTKEGREAIRFMLDLARRQAVDDVLRGVYKGWKPAKPLAASSAPTEPKPQTWEDLVSRIQEALRAAIDTEDSSGGSGDPPPFDSTQP